MAYFNGTAGAAEIGISCFFDQRTFQALPSTGAADRARGSARCRRTTNPGVRFAARFSRLLHEPAYDLVGHVGHGPAKPGAIALLRGRPDHVPVRVDQTNGGRRFMAPFLRVAAFVLRYSGARFAL